MNIHPQMALITEITRIISAGCGKEIAHHPGVPDIIPTGTFPFISLFLSCTLVLLYTYLRYQQSNAHFPTI